MALSPFDYEIAEYEKEANVRRIKRRVENEYYIDGDYAYVKLRWTDEEKIMVCDKEDWERLKKYTWGVAKTGGYAITNFAQNKKHKVVKFHQIVMGQKRGYVVDHINRNPIDNRKENLRYATMQQNLINKGKQSNNKSGIPGVSWRNDSNSWRAQIWVHKKAINLGTFKTKEEAIKARKEAEKKYFEPLFEVAQ